MGIRSELGSRPLSLRLFVGLSLIIHVVSVVRAPRLLTFPWLIFTLISLFLLKLLWGGSGGVWWLFTIGNGVAVALTGTSVADGRGEWINLLTCGIAFALLVAPSTRTWFNQQIEASGRG